MKLRLKGSLAGWAQRGLAEKKMMQWNFVFSPLTFTDNLMACRAPIGPNFLECIPNSFASFSPHLASTFSPHLAPISERCFKYVLADSLLSPPTPRARQVPSTRFLFASHRCLDIFENQVFVNPHTFSNTPQPLWWSCNRPLGNIGIEW